MILLQASTPTPSSMPTLIMFGLFFIVMYFFMIRPQIKKQKKEKEYRSSLKKGDEIITIGGIHAKIVSIKKDVFIIETHGGTTLKVQREAVAMGSSIAIEK